MELTGLDIDSVADYSGYISRAQKEFELRTQRVFDGEEDDYQLAQRAVAFLTAYYIRLHRQEVEFAKTELIEYHRLIKHLMLDVVPEKQIFWQPVINSVEQSDLGDTSR